MQRRGFHRRHGQAHLPTLHGDAATVTSYVTIVAIGQAGTEGSSQSTPFPVDGHKALVATAEGNLVITVIPPMADAGTIRHIAESHHVGNRIPTVLTRSEERRVGKE